MRFSNEFKKWWQEYSRKNCFPNKVEGFYTFDLQTTYDAFHAHDEELDRLRKFEKDTNEYLKRKHKQESLERYDYDLHLQYMMREWNW